MARKRIKVFSLVVLVIIGCMLYFVGYLTCKYYGIIIPEFSDNRYFVALEKRAEAAIKVARRNNLNENYCLFIDYSIPSGTPRLFVWSFKDKRVAASTYVMHGPGKGSTAEKPVFSNRPGSLCSALGRFVVTKRHGTKIKRSYRLRGLDINNMTAESRGLMIHRSTWVDRHCWMNYIPLHAKSCEGCVTVSSRGLAYLEKLIEGEKKNMLLWSFN